MPDDDVRERVFGSPKDDTPYRRHIDDAVDLGRDADASGVDVTTVRSHEQLACSRPADVHVGRADPDIPTFDEPEIPQST